MKKIMLSLVTALAGFCGFAENVFTLGPAGSGATYTDLQTALTEAGQTTTTIRLCGDVTEEMEEKKSWTIATKQDITIDLNGCTLHANLPATPAAIKVNGSLTIKDSKGGGRFTYYRKAIGIQVEADGTFTLESGTLEATFIRASSSVLKSFGICNINGGTIENGDTENSFDGSCVGVDGGKTTIRGGTMMATGKQAAAIYNNATLNIEAETTVTIGTTTGNDVIWARDGEMSIKGKDVHVTGNLSVGSNKTDGTLTISGGTYSVDPSSVYLASDYRSVAYTENEATRYMVVPTPISPVAREITGTATWEQVADGVGVTLTAMDAAQVALAGETILLSELTITNAVDVSAASLAWSGSGSLTSQLTRVHIDTDFSGISGAIDLGYLIIDDGVTVTLDPRTEYVRLGTTGAIRFYDSTSEHLTLTLGPVGSGATYSDFAEAFKAAGTTNTTVQLIGDVDNATSIVTIESDQNITLDLKGYSLSLEDITKDTSGKNRITIKDDGQLTIKDSSINGTGVCTYYTGNSRDKIKGGALVHLDGGTFTLDRGTIKNTCWYSGAVLSVYGTSKCNIKGGLITSASTQDPCIYVSASGKLTISGGRIDDALINRPKDSNKNSIINLGKASASCFITATDAPVMIHNGDNTIALNVNKNGGNIFVTGKNVHVTGKLTVNNSNGTITISGGRYSVEPQATYLAKGYRVTMIEEDDGRSWYKVSPPGFSVILR